MTPKDENQLNAPAPEDGYSLEEILAEYGGSLEHHLLRETEPPEAPAPGPAPPEAPPVPVAPPEPEAPPPGPAPEPPPEPGPDPLQEAEKAAEADVARLNIPHPKPISLEIGRAHV